MARQALTALRTAGRLPTLLHVGPKDLSNNRTKPFYEALFGNRSDCLQAVMVEANPDVATLLQQRLTEYFSPCPDRSVLTAALCSVDAEAASFFSLSEEVYTKYSVQELGGITTAASYGSLNLHFLLQDILDRTTGIQAEDLMPFIQERSVTCISPSSLLQLESLEPLDMLFLDTADGLGIFTVLGPSLFCLVLFILRRLRPTPFLQAHTWSSLGGYKKTKSRTLFFWRAKTLNPKP